MPQRRRASSASKLPHILELLRDLSPDLVHLRRRGRRCHPEDTHAAAVCTLHWRAGSEGNLRRRSLALQRALAPHPGSPRRRARGGRRRAQAQPPSWADVAPRRRLRLGAQRVGQRRLKRQRLQLLHRAVGRGRQQRGRGCGRGRRRRRALPRGPQRAPGASRLDGAVALPELADGNAGAVAADLRPALGLGRGGLGPRDVRH
mmetsp:Transcript_141021/g.450954  ORF Transcript_141021/g.450954 Transcript_141021/m.450954 type:complete len:203 (-) Transcript_141021:638-1246(-)